MGRLIGMLSGFVVYLCIGTLIAQAIIVGYAWSKGFLTSAKVFDMLAVAQGAPLKSPDDDNKKSAEPAKTSFEELDKRRTTQARHLELREQAVKNAMDQINLERSKLLRDKEEFEMLVTSFRKEKEEFGQQKSSKGETDVRLIWENVKPKLAKDLILKMIEAEEKEQVVAILSQMPITKQAKIVSEFKTEDEQTKIDDILRRVRRGGAETAQPESQP